MMRADSKATEAIRAILHAEFDTEPVFDQSHGDANLTFRLEGKRYRVYASGEFEEDFEVMEARLTHVRAGLSTYLRIAPNGAVIVTTSGIKEHRGADF